MNWKFVIFLLCIARFSSGYAIPEGPLPDAVFDRAIHTIIFQKDGVDFSYPIIDINNQESLFLSFDYLSEETKNLNYSIVLCDADWMPSRLSYTEYMNGFFQNSLFQYQSSFNTHILYKHYELRIPNENVGLKLPGNYAVVIYEGGNDNEPVMIKRFAVVENRIKINANVHRPVLPAYQNEYQEVDFSVVHNDYVIDNPFQTVKAVIIKNNQWSNSITDLKPLFIRNNELVYDYEDKNLFPGGNEYRNFDIKNLKYQQPNVKSINLVNDHYEVELLPDKRRNRLPYLYQFDLNGNFLVQNQQGQNPSVDADYVFVKFSLESFEEIPDGNVYVIGGFSDNNCYEDNKMDYNSEKGVYELTIPVKQGYYNYIYAFQDKKGEVDEQLLEGSFYETGNDYVIYFYHRPIGQRYDALIGVTVVNTIKNYR